VAEARARAYAAIDTIDWPADLPPRYRLAGIEDHFEARLKLFGQGSRKDQHTGH